MINLFVHHCMYPIACIHFIHFTHSVFHVVRFVKKFIFFNFFKDITIFYALWCYRNKELQLKSNNATVSCHTENLSSKARKSNRWNFKKIITLIFIFETIWQIRRKASSFCFFDLPPPRNTIFARGIQ
jgi:hypothetical protein